MLFGAIKTEKAIPNIGQNNIVAKTQTISKVETVVYRTEYGTKYHTENCQYLRKSKIEIRLSVAKETGLKPCSVCKP